MSASESRRQRTGLALCRHYELSDPVVHAGLRLDPPADVLLACARDLHLLDLVVALDSAMHLRQCSQEDVQAAASRRRRGAPRLRQALELSDSRAESAWESMLRVLHVTCEVDVEPQYVLRDRAGAVLGRADLWLRGTNALHEYDGQHHLTRDQQRVDLRRARRLGNDDWLRRGYTSGDVLQQAVSILRDSDLSLGRSHRPARIRPWHALLKDSLFTSSGQERLRQRLNLGGPTGVPTWGRSA